MLRPYQFDARNAVHTAFDSGIIAVMVEMATGTGKTVLFAEVANDFSRASLGRVLIVCPFLPLVGQAARKIKQRTGIDPDIEQAENRSNEFGWARNQFVVASKSTLLSKMGEGIRAERLKGIGLVIFDETHLGIQGIRRLMDVFGPQGAKFLGVTATAKRHDKVGLGNVFEKCVYQYGILDAINDGWLVSPRAKCVTIASLDLSKVDVVQTVNGKDFSQEQLAKALEEEKTVVETSEVVAREHHGEKTVVYCESVEQARMISNRLVDVHGVRSAWICADTKRLSKRDRHAALESFTEPDGLGVLCNVGVLTTGWDYPGLKHIVMARPTRSLALYTQILGRGTRALEGVVDFADSTPDSRRAAIAASGKPFFRVTDLVDASLEHKIVTAIDALAGNALPVVIAKAKAEAAKNGRLIDVQEAIEESESACRIDDFRSRLAALSVRVQAVEQPVDVFDARSRSTGKRRENVGATMPFGRHRGKPLDRLPTPYLAWVLKKAKPNTRFHQSVQEAIEVRASRKRSAAPA